jgi:hypothetical protein
MAPYQYVISLRISHPIIPHDEISSAVGMHPETCWTAATPRFSPTGTPTGGLHKSTYWCVGLTAETTISEPIDVEQALGAHADGLAPLTAFFNRVRNEGGRVELFVGLFSENNIVIDLEPMLMGRLAQAALSVSLDYYPWART